MDDGIIIGEGVVLDARPASFATRMLAIALDVLLEGLLLMFLVWLTPAGAVVDQDLSTTVTIIAVVTILVVVPTTVETLSRGRSVGKLALGLRIVRDDGGPVRVRHAFIRALVGVGELWLTFGTVALFTSLSNTKGKRVGDILAGTYAIRVRGGRRSTTPIFMPVHLEGWAVRADMRRLPDGLALSARQFLARRETMNPASRQRMGTELAARVEAFVAPGPPPATDPETFLMAVLVERRAREWAAARRGRALAAEQAELVRRLPYLIPDPPN